MGKPYQHKTEHSLIPKGAELPVEPSELTQAHAEARLIAIANSRRAQPALGALKLLADMRGWNASDKTDARRDMMQLWREVRELEAKAERPGAGAITVEAKPVSRKSHK